MTYSALKHTINTIWGFVRNEDSRDPPRPTDPETGSRAQHSALASPADDRGEA